jgi:hypothetical protein
VAGGKNKLEEEAIVKFWLLTRPQNYVRRLALLLKIFLSKYNNNNNNNNNKPQQKLPLQTLVSELDCAAVFFSRPKKGHSAPDVTWAYAWRLVSWNITPKFICNVITLFANTVCRDKTVIKGATHLLQQPEVCA